MLISEKLILPPIQELLCTSGTWSGWTLTLKSSSCSCANISVLASKGEKTTLLGKNEDQTVLFNVSVRLCRTKAQPSCGFKRCWKHSSVMGIETYLTLSERLGLSKGSGKLKARTAQAPSGESCWIHHHIGATKADCSRRTGIQCATMEITSQNFLNFMHFHIPPQN